MNQLIVFSVVAYQISFFSAQTDYPVSLLSENSNMSSTAHKTEAEYVVALCFAFVLDQNAVFYSFGCVKADF